MTAPAEGFSGEVAGVVFRAGHAEADDEAHAAALGYFRRRGYTVEAFDAPAAAQEAEAPKRSASKAAWVEYAVAQGMEEAEVDQFTRDQLVELLADKAVS